MFKLRMHAARIHNLLYIHTVLDEAEHCHRNHGIDFHKQKLKQLMKGSDSSTHKVYRMTDQKISVYILIS